MVNAILPRRVSITECSPDWVHLDITTERRHDTKSSIDELRAAHAMLWLLLEERSNGGNRWPTCTQYDDATHIVADQRSCV